MIVAGFRHLTSRGGDPQLHTHCVLANMTRNASGEWRSVEPTAIRRSEKLIGAYYRNELARRLQALVMAVTPTLVGRVPGFELAGYDKSFLDAFSGRRAEILAYLKEHDLPYNARNAEIAALRTRAAKKEVGLSQLVPEWRERARAMGLSRDKAVLRPARPIDPAMGKQVPPVEVPPPDLPANEMTKLRRAPKLPPLPRDPGLAELGKAHAPEAATAADLSPAPETGVLECCLAYCLTARFPDYFARRTGGFPGLRGRFDEVLAGCRPAVGASSRCAAPPLAADAGALSPGVRVDAAVGKTRGLAGRVAGAVVAAPLLQTGLSSTDRRPAAGCSPLSGQRSGGALGDEKPPSPPGSGSQRAASATSVVPARPPLIRGWS